MNAERADAGVTGPPRILLVSGSTRSGSTNTAALRTLRALAAPPVTAVLYEAMAGLPAFNPDDDHDPLPPAVARLRQQPGRPGHPRRPAAPPSPPEPARAGAGPDRLRRERGSAARTGHSQTAELFGNV